MAKIGSLFGTVVSVIFLGLQQNVILRPRPRATSRMLGATVYELLFLELPFLGARVSASSLRLGT